MRRVVLSSVMALALFAGAAVLSGSCLACAGTAVMEAKPAKKTAEVTFHVHLHCQDCVEKVQENLSFEKGVKDLEVSLEKQTVWIKYDPAKTDEEKLMAALKRIGYDPVKAENAPEENKNE